MPPQWRLAEVVAAISLATDLGMGQPLQHALRTCVIATRLADAAELPPRELPVVYYTALLRYLGCTADAHMMSVVFGDEIAARAAFATIDPTSAREQLGWLARHAAAGHSLPRRAVTLAGVVAEGRSGTREVYATACEVARRLAERLGLPEDVRLALLHAFERWDGKGFPAGLSGEQICPGSRVVAIARDAQVFQRIGGLEAAVEVVAARAGAAYDPGLADVFRRNAGDLLAEPDSAWDAALAAEPPPRRHVSELDDTCHAMGDFADIKTPWTVGHSTGVAELAEAAAWRLDLPAEEVTALRRAALVHDLVHGSWGDHHTWDALVPELPDGLRVIRYDRRGHSASERPPGQGSIEEDVADLAAIIETVADGPAHVVGNSQGAQIALRLACSRPDLVRSLAIHEPGLWALAPEDPAVQALQASIEPVLRLLEAGACEDGARHFIDLILGPGAWDGVLSDGQRQAFVANAPTFLDEERDPDASVVDPTLLAELPAPLLLSSGDESAAAFHVVIERLAAALPHAERASLAGAGHSPHRTHPAEYAALLTSFWASRMRDRTGAVG